MKEQNHKIYTVNGFTGNLREIAEHFGIKYLTLHSRIKRYGMSIEDAVNNIVIERPNSGRIYTVNGFTGKLTEIAKFFKIDYDALKYRVYRLKMPIENAVSELIEKSEELSALYSINGFTGNLKQIADHFGLDYKKLLIRIYRKNKRSALEIIESEINTNISK